MPNYLARFEHTTRSIDHVGIYQGFKEFNNAKSEKQVKLTLHEIAHKNKLENFKILSVSEYDCLKCFDTGQSRHSGSACC